uniref:Uncharacterized protein n=1 Tax=Tanacetum cinerariifolium TaxID=118510 RepID=A0A6L2LVV4_TANCI|nr:hypothetical protein [Tanacetum cinerariifolium]
MNPVLAQQTTLDNALVAPDDRVKIGKCNMRINPSKKPKKEPTYQVVLDILALSHCYHAFLITKEVLEVYMQQFWFTISKMKDSSSYQFKLDKKKCRIDVEKLQNSDSYKTYLAFLIGAATPKKDRKRKKPASPLKKQTLVILKNLSRNLLLEFSQLMKKAIKMIKRKTHMHQAGGSCDGAGLESEVPDELKGKSINTHEGTGLKPGVLNVSKADFLDSEYESWGVSDDDDDDQQGDDERTESNDDKSVDLNKTDDDEEDEFVHTIDNYVPADEETNDVDEEEYKKINEEMYDDANMELTDLENEVKSLRNNDYGLVIRATIKSEIPTIVKELLGTSLDDALHNVIQRHTTKLIKEHFVPTYVVEVLQQLQKPQKSAADIRKIKMEQAGKQQETKYSITSSDKAAVTPRQGRNARRNENGYQHNTMASI